MADTAGSELLTAAPSFWIAKSCAVLLPASAFFCVLFWFLTIWGISTKMQWSNMLLHTVCSIQPCWSVLHMLVLREIQTLCVSCCSSDRTRVPVFDVVSVSCGDANAVCSAYCAACRS